MLSECVENTNKKFMSYFEDSVVGFPERIEEAALDDLILIKEDYLMPYLNFVKENRFVFAAAVNSPGGMQSAGKYEGLYKHVFNPILERFHYPENERRYAINFYISGIVAVIYILHSYPGYNKLCKSSKKEKSINDNAKKYIHGLCYCGTIVTGTIHARHIRRCR